MIKLLWYYNSCVKQVTLFNVMCCFGYCKYCRLDTNICIWWYINWLLYINYIWSLWTILDITHIRSRIWHFHHCIHDLLKETIPVMYKTYYCRSDQVHLRISPGHLLNWPGPWVIHEISPQTRVKLYGAQNGPGTITAQVQVHMFKWPRTLLRWSAPPRLKS